MRLYGKKFFGNKLTAVADSRTESRDAILWDIQKDQRLCRVKIQGSDELIIAHYPENWEQTPTWLKPGNAVRITFRGGKRGKIELVGNGQTIPIPVSGTATPPIAIPVDCLLSGCQIVEIPSGACMAVMVQTGALRILGSTKYVSAINMKTGSSDYQMGMGGNMSEVAGVFAFTAPSGTLFQYISFAVNLSDMTVYKFTGNTSSTAPTKPTIPDGYMYLGSILLYGGMTKITAADINTEFQVLVPTFISPSFRQKDGASFSSTWVTQETPAGRPGYVVDININDQYGRLISNNYISGYSLIVECTDKDSDITAVNIYPNYTSESDSGVGSATRVIQNASTPVLIEIPAADDFALFTVTLKYGSFSIQNQFCVPYN